MPIRIYVIIIFRNLYLYKFLSFKKNVWGVTARTEQYSIPFLVYMNNEAFQSMVMDGMLIRNHDFHRSVELVGAVF